MGTRDSYAARRRRSSWAARAAAGVGAALLLTGCAMDDFRRGYLPEASIDATNHTERVQTLWNGSWVAALAVGVVVWGLTLWCVVRYRRRKNDPELPPQVRYNMPIEILYTVLPILMVGVLFYYTARDEAAILDTDSPADHTVQVVGKKWGWDFNYVEENVYEKGRQAGLKGVPGVEETLPTLVLPVDREVEFELVTVDVNHSFWIPAFLFKMDLIAGSPNVFQVVPTKEGTFQGKCAELCGEYHAEMLFNVRVVSEAEYDDYIQSLRDRGQEGQLLAQLAGELTRGGSVPADNSEGESGAQRRS